MKVIDQVWNFIRNRNLLTVKFKVRDLVPKFNSNLQSHPTSEEVARFAVAPSGYPSRIEIGRELREAREASGQKLEDISKSLRIKYEFLESIEDGNYDCLPGLTYTIGFIKSYAQFLGLNVNESIALFKTQADILEPTNETVFPVPTNSGIVPNFAVLGVAVLVTTGGYVVWNNINQEPLAPLNVASTSTYSAGSNKIEHGDSTTKYRQKESLPTIDRRQIVTSQDIKKSPGKIEADSPIKSDDKNKKIESTSETKNIREKISSIENTPPKTTDDDQYTRKKKKERAYTSKIKQRVTPRTAKTIDPERDHENSQFTIKAIADSWIEISTSTSDVLVSRVMTAGELVTILDKRDLFLSTGNINALVIELNGIIIDGLDRSDRIVKNISLSHHRP